MYRLASLYISGIGKFLSLKLIHLKEKSYIWNSFALPGGVSYNTFHLEISKVGKLACLMPINLHRCIIMHQVSPSHAKAEQLPSLHTLKVSMKLH
jgi:hypothetical protein